MVRVQKAWLNQYNTDADTNVGTCESRTGEASVQMVLLQEMSTNEDACLAARGHSGDRDADKDADKDADRDADKDADRDAGRNADRDANKGEGLNSAHWAGLLLLTGEVLVAEEEGEEEGSQEAAGKDVEVGDDWCDEGGGDARREGVEGREVSQGPQMHARKTTERRWGNCRLLLQYL